MHAESYGGSLYEQDIILEEEKAQTECGIFAIYSPETLDIQTEAFPMLLTGTQLQQSRGPQSVGYACQAKEGTVLLRLEGTIEDNLQNGALDISRYYGRTHFGMGHTRWTTAGESIPSNIHPIPFDLGDYKTGFLMTNGNTPAAAKLKRFLQDQGRSMDHRASDTFMMAAVLECAPGSTLEEKWLWLLQQPEVMNSAYCAVAAHGDELFAAVDRFGVHPLLLGEFDNNGKKGYMLSSEDRAILYNRGRVIRAINPGEVIKIDKNGVHVLEDGKKLKNPGRCIFETLYFQHANSHEYDPERPVDLPPTVAYKRYQLGILSGQQYKEQLDKVDFIAAVPNSGNWFGHGLSRGSGKAILPIMQRNFTDRTFTQGQNPDETMAKVKSKITFLDEPRLLEGAHVALGDDSLIQGNTMKSIIEILKKNRVAKISVFLSMPQVVDMCHLGVNLKDRDQMIAYICNGDPEVIAWAIGAMEVCYPSHENVIRALNLVGKDPGDIVIPDGYDEQRPELLYRANGWCPGCVTGQHLVDPYGNMLEYNGHRKNVIPLVQHA